MNRTIGLFLVVVFVVTTCGCHTVAHRPRPQGFREWQQTVAQVRSLATILELHRQGAGRCPVLSATAVSSTLIAMLRAGTTEDLSGFQLGTHDAWGNPIWLASDGEHYAVWSYGADGVVDDTWVSADLVFDVATDIIIVDGNFIHYNAGMGAIEGSGLENLVNTAKQLAGAHGPQ